MKLQSASPNYLIGCPSANSIFAQSVLPIFFSLIKNYQQAWTESLINCEFIGNKYVNAFIPLHRSQEFTESFIFSAHFSAFNYYLLTLIQSKFK